MEEKKGTIGWISRKKISLVTAYTQFNNIKSFFCLKMWKGGFSKA